MCEEAEKRYVWGTMKSSGIRVSRGCELSMWEPRSVGDIGVEEVAGKRETSTRSERQKVVGACSG